MTLNLSRVSFRSVPGRLLRLPLRLVPQRLTVPILQGPLAGTRWIVGASTHGCWLGTYELAKQQQFASMASRARFVFDVGANAGFYTLLSAVVGGPSCHVFAFEPLPRNVEFLEAHVRLNKLAERVNVFPVAVSDAEGMVQFDDGAGPAMGSMAPTGRLTVCAVTLDALSAAGRIGDPDLMKIDVEGAEEAVLAGADALIQRARPTIFLSTHGHDIHVRCLTWLRAHGYVLQETEPAEIVARHPSMMTA